MLWALGWFFFIGAGFRLGLIVWARKRDEVRGDPSMAIGVLTAATLAGAAMLILAYASG